MGEGVYAHALADHHAIIRAALVAHGGDEVGTQGDSFFATFLSPLACIAAAVEVQRALEAHRWPGQEKLRARMGVHVGEATNTATGLVGLDVHRAARVGAVAHGGQVVVSESAAVLARDRLPDGVVLVDLGDHRLKDLGRPERVYQVQAPGLQSEFPPLRSLGDPSLQNNLPVQLTTFIGRDRELSEVRGLVEDHRLVTITGPGGAGKTRLALQVAADLLDGSSEGVWLVELAPVADQDAVAGVICQALGVVPQAGRDSLAVLLEALALQRLLLVLDNCEHLIGTCAKVADAILRQCPRVHLVATSREPLGISGETIYRAPSLSLPDDGQEGGLQAQTSDAVALFLERARAQGVVLPADETTLDLVGSICRRLDGLPLAIELAAARLRGLSLSNLNQRLDQRFRLLTGGSRSALERQQTLQATVQWSYSLLNPSERCLLARLSMFVDSFDLEAAEGVCGYGEMDVLDVADLLGSLVDKSLVVAEQTGPALRYRLLETIRQFAAERLADGDSEEAEQCALKHSEWFLSVAESAAPHLVGPQQAEWFLRLDADLSNLRKAADHAAADPKTIGRALRFAVALGRYWWARSLFQECARFVSRVSDGPELEVSAKELAPALVNLGILSRSLLHLDEARRLIERAVACAREADDTTALVRSTSMLASICYFAGEPETGTEVGREAVELARALGDDVLLAESLVGYLSCSGELGRPETPELYAEGIAATDRSGDVFVRYMLTNNAGVDALQRDDIAGARRYLEAAAVGHERISVRGPSFYISGNMGWVLLKENKTDEGLSSFRQALRASLRVGDRVGLSWCTLGVACACGEAGDWARAALLLGAADTFLALVGDHWPGLERKAREASVAEAKECLGVGEFQQLYERGRGWGQKEAVDFALRPSAEAPGASP